MPYPPRSKPSVASYLNPKAQAAYKQACSLTKDALTKEEQKTIDGIVEEYSVDQLQLGSHKVKVDDKIPNRATVTWAIIGDSGLVGLQDSSGTSLDVSKVRSFEDTFEYPSSIGDNMALLQEIKQRISLKADAYTTHFNRINAEVQAHNQHLRDNVPEWVRARLKVVAGAKSAEDFLNS